MADISKCRGIDCPLKENCVRYTAPEGVWQSWFFDVPIKEDGTCDYYWEDKKKE